MRSYTFLDTLTELEARAATVHTTTETLRSKTAASDYLRPLAAELREVGDLDAGVSYADLYAVSSGAFTVPDAPRPYSDDGRPGSPLRKLAHELRALDRQRALHKSAQASNILRAADGLTLLRDRLGSRS